VSYVQVLHCDSCGYGFTPGHGVRRDEGAEHQRGMADWFCSERCRVWFDNGEPNYKQQQEIVRKSVDWVYPHLESDLKKKSEAKKKLETLADCLDCSPKRIKDETIEGNRGSLHFDGDTIKLTAHAHSKRKFSSLKKQLSFMSHDGHTFDTDMGYSTRWSMPENPTPEQSKTIRKIVGLKQSTPTPKETD
jgi:hypothetical protein